MTALLANTRSKALKGRCKGAAYYRCFGNQNLATLLSRTQALVIQSGQELERMIMARVQVVDDVDAYLQTPRQSGVFVVPKKAIKKSKTLAFDGVEPDFMVFDEQGTHKCHIVELKDGCEFDTKASSAEMDTVFRFIRTNAQHIPYTVEGHICCFNVDTRDEIVRGFKNKLTIEQALTGREFCKLLNIEYDEIVRVRASDRAENLSYFMRELMTDPVTANIAKQILLDE